MKNFDPANFAQSPITILRHPSTNFIAISGFHYSLFCVHGKSSPQKELKSAEVIGRSQTSRSIRAIAYPHQILENIQTSKVFKTFKF
ncbi:hypothetical protein [Chryseobacterium sp.]|uniref:hypothetical protein n=1 Tax=Chryseobacterium sp. TaxID=1871047 RepID=UPI00388D5C77